MSKALYIAEKPSVAQEFAKALKINTNRKNGYLLKTAYPIIYKHKREAIEKKANENGI